MSINLSEQIVIIDEAHNIEDSSRDAASVLITKSQIEQAITDLNKILDKTSLNQSDEERSVCRYFVAIVS